MRRAGVLLLGLGGLAALVFTSLNSSPATAAWLLVGLAWILGAFVGWTLNQPMTTQSPAPAPRAVSFVPVPEPDPVESTGHDLEVVEGIGSGYGRRLRELGVVDTLALVRKGAAETGRSELATALKVEPLVVQRWTSMADLLRVPGMDGQSAEVLEAAGVHSIAALAQESPTGLVGILYEVNERLRLTPDALPGVDQLSNWVGMASLLPEWLDDL